MTDVQFPIQGSDDPQRKFAASWISQQRTFYSSGSLPQSRIERLENTPGWTWSILADQWDAIYRNVLAFFLENRRCPSGRSKTPEEVCLSDWCLNQRQHYKNHANRLTCERIALLEAIPGWLWIPFEGRWKIQYQALAVFMKKNQRFPRCDSKVSDEALLGRWVHRQRNRKRRNLLSKERVERLENIPIWEWEPRPDHWHAHYERWRQFVEEEGRLPSGYHSKEKFLASWRASQCSMYKKGKLTQDKIDKLDQIPAWTWCKPPSIPKSKSLHPPKNFQKQWNKYYEQVLAFVEKHGKLPG